jgi:hypothetical protein
VFAAVQSGAGEQNVPNQKTAKPKGARDQNGPLKKQLASKRMGLLAN